MTQHHPAQVRIWTALDRVQLRKAWAIDLDVAESEISRWASGSRAMSIDDLAATVRVARLAGDRGLDAASKVTALVAELLAGDAPPPVPDADASTIAQLAIASGDVARLLDDGRVTGPVEAARARAIADELRHQADRLDAAAAAA